MSPASPAELATTDRRTWLNTADVAARSRRHNVTIRRAASSGELHSHQPAQRGHRRFHIDAVDAWMRGQNKQQQAAACGCQRLQGVKRRGAA
ncbi:helix-turn-helix domain-containing protein [Umezawaea tangerina]|uniref:Excisionase family DNA binding protein n=1 Tax=Umezawaea tangerina TaxID=84725 RepID=A0A2T0SPD8_9PSEU|nr:helix-turn-helix domain-containing protein [Umezawaea tangerina]PRY35274.1 excisionase family DNA binding protein [Umezawaea tangerina]